MSKFNTPGIPKPEATQLLVSPPLPARHKWPKSARLTSSDEFRRVRERGKTAHSSLLRMSCLALEGERGARIGLVTSRKVGGAVVRNRVRRRLREIFRGLLPQISSGWWVVVTAKPGAGSVPFSNLQEECLLLARRLSILPRLQ